MIELTPLGKARDMRGSGKTTAAAARARRGPRAASHNGLARRVDGVAAQYQHYVSLTLTATAAGIRQAVST